LIAADVIAHREPFSEYPRRLANRFGASSSWLTRIGAHLPRRFLADHVVPTRMFARRVVLERWFLHTNEH